jgi:hypothetical protein
VASELAAAAAARATAEREEARALRARRAAWLAAAARLGRERTAVAEAADKAIDPARALLREDLKPLGALPEERQRGDAGLREYLRERFVARLADPVVAELSRGLGEAPPPRAGAAVRAVLMGAVASQDAPAHLLEGPLSRVLEAAVEAFAAALSAEASQREVEEPAAALELRALALREAFGS